MLKPGLKCNLAFTESILSEDEAVELLKDKRKSDENFLDIRFFQRISDPGTIIYRDPARLVLYSNEMGNMDEPLYPVFIRSNYPAVYPDIPFTPRMINAEINNRSVQSRIEDPSVWIEEYEKEAKFFKIQLYSRYENTAVGRGLLKIQKQIHPILA